MFIQNNFFVLPVFDFLILLICVYFNTEMP